MNEILKTMPNSVVYRYDREEFEKMVEAYLSKEVDESVCVNVELDCDVDLIRMDLDENSELLLEKLDSKGFPSYDENTLMDNILNGMFHSSYSVSAYVKSECGTHFDVLVHIPYKVFHSLTCFTSWTNSI